MFIPVTAQPVDAAYVAGCRDSDWYGNMKYINERSKPDGMSAVLMDIDARQLKACLPDEIDGSASYVLASLQSSRKTQYNIVQIGLGRCTKARGCGGSSDGGGAIPADGRTHFIYTKFDGNGGLIYLADQWYGEEPIIGHRYRMKITSDGSDWMFEIRNMTRGQSYVTKSRDRTWGSSTGTLAWWGGEVFYTNDAMGSSRPESYELDIRSQYLLGGRWWQTDGADQGCTRYYDPVIQFPSYFDCYFVTRDVTRDTQWVNTGSH